MQLMVSGLRLRSGDPQIIHADVVLGSDTYFALPSVRESLKTNILKEAIELQLVLNQTVPNVFGANKSRAVMVYLPPNNDMFVDQLKWLYLSIGEMRTTQKPNLKTDLLIFAHPSIVNKTASDLGCKTTVRKSFDDSETCIVLPHTPLHERKIPVENLMHNLQNYSSVIDSMTILSEFQYADNYDNLLRTDLDTFITPGFGKLELPEKVAIITGRGGYYSRNTALRLDWIATKKLGLKYNHYENVGSTWYGHSKLLVAAGRLSIAVMQWLSTQEFTEFESLLISGTAGWPNWYKPVMSMYSGDIAINTISTDRLRQSNIGGEFSFDRPASTFDFELPDSVQHLHSFQVQEPFSKLRFKTGDYANMSLAPYANDNSTIAYAMTIAISSSRLTMTELGDYVSNTTAMKNHEWMRKCPPHNISC
jgi:hypothetical protein